MLARPTYPIRRGRALLAALLVAIGTSAFAADFFVDADTDLLLDSNVGRAGSSADRRDDLILGAGAGVGALFAIGQRSGLRLFGGARHERFAELESLSNVSLAVDVGYRVEPFSGYRAPWFGLNARIEAREHSDSDIRSGLRTGLRAEAGARLTDRISGVVGYRFRRNAPRTGELFDTRAHSAFIDLDYDLDRRATLYATYAIERGDVVSTAPFSASLVAASKSRGMDPAFGPAFRAWRLDATTQSFRLGTNLALSRSQSLDFAVGYADSSGDGGNDYRSVNLVASWLARFR